MFWRVKTLTFGGEAYLFHVLAADAEAAPSDASDNLEFRLIRRLTFHAEPAEVLNAGLCEWRSSFTVSGYPSPSVPQRADVHEWAVRGSHLIAVPQLAQ